MTEVDYSVPPDKLPIWLLPVTIVLLLVPLAPYIMQDGYLTLFSLGDWRIIPLIIALILAHEAVHAIAWKLASGLAWSEFNFGFSWKALAPYCHAKTAMSARAYRIGTIMPGIVTGLVPLLIAYILWSAPLMLVGGIMISAAVGDLYVLWLIRAVPANAQLLDHPSQVGCIAYLPEDV